MVAVLIDIQKRDQQIIGIYTRASSLEKRNVLTYADCSKAVKLTLRICLH